MQPYVFTSKNKAKRIFQSDIRCKDVDKKVKKQENRSFFHFLRIPPRNSIRISNIRTTCR